MEEKRLFNNVKLQDEFDKEGVLKLDFATEEIVEQLLSTFHSFHSISDERMQSGYYFSIFGVDKDYMANIRDKFYPILKPLLNKYFNNFKVLSIVLQIKGTSDDSSVGIHQDLTTVDERKFGAATLWIPLTNSNQRNGAISFLKGSHNCFNNFRAHTIEDYQFENVEQFIYQNSERFDASIGQALVFHPATIHYSPQNNSGEPRLSIAISIVSKNAKVQLGYLDKCISPWRLELYSVPDNFYYLYENFDSERFERPKFGYLEGFVEQYIIRSYDLRSFRRKYFRNYKRKQFRLHSISAFISYLGSKFHILKYSS